MIRSTHGLMGGIPPTFAQILGANYFDDWDFGSAANMVIVSGAVNTITSKTGSGRNFLQGTANRMPLLVANQINGKSVARFDGINDAMQFSNTSSYNFLHQSQGCVISIYKFDNSLASTVDRRIFNTVTFSTGRGYIIGLGAKPSTTVNNLVYKGSSGVILALNARSVSDVTWHSSVSVLDLANATPADRMSTNFNNKNLVLNGQNQTVSAGAHSNPTIGHDPSLTNYPFKGDIARIIIANTKPTQAQLDLIQRRLFYEYGDFAI
jgi:hypothetical protein